MLPAGEFDCKRRDCEVCGPRRARVTARMLMIDALACPPTHAVTLTTRRVSTTSAEVRHGLQMVARRLRRHYGRDVEYWCRVEFTSGRAATSGGHRRIHLHGVWKGLGAAPLPRLRRLVRETWLETVGAWRTDVSPLRTQVGALHYLALHHAKPQQLPPGDWRGMAERPSRGYFAAAVPELREEAHRQLWAEGLARATGLTVDDARFLVDGVKANQALARDQLAEARRLAREDAADAAQDALSWLEALPPASAQGVLFDAATSSAVASQDMPG